MKRKKFLKGIGMAGIGLSLPLSASQLSKKSRSSTGGECVLIPSETAGPFPLDLTDNQFYFRQDIRESFPGVQLNLKMKINGLENCEPMQNVRVHIWHCDKDGVYSGYNTGLNPGDLDATHFRGYQMTDAHGEVEFITIFPGWYPGRIVHFHFEVYVSSSYSAVSQFTFPLVAKNELYASAPELYTKGADPLSFSQDFAFSDQHVHQVATLEPDPETGGYSSFLEVTVEGSGVTGVGHVERETFKVMELGQNYPNPYTEKTTIPIKLKQMSDLKVELWDLSGKKVATILDVRKASGDYKVDINPTQLGLSNGNYIYQVEARNTRGIFRLPKMMTYQS